MITPFKAILIILGAGFSAGSVLWGYLTHIDIQDVDIKIDGGDLDKIPDKNATEEKRKKKYKSKKREKIYILLMGILGIVLLLWAAII